MRGREIVASGVGIREGTGIFNLDEIFAVVIRREDDVDGVGCTERRIGLASNKSLGGLDFTLLDV